MTFEPDLRLWADAESGCLRGGLGCGPERRCGSRGTERGSPLAGPRGLAVEQRVPLADQEALQSGEEAKAVPTQQLGDAVLARPVKAGTPVSRVSKAAAVTPWPPVTSSSQSRIPGPPASGSSSSPPSSLAAGDHEIRVCHEPSGGVGRRNERDFVGGAQTVSHVGRDDVCVSVHRLVDH
jgi:hypothetical protein